MTEPVDVHGIACLAAARLHEFLETELQNELNRRHPGIGLKWSPNMPDDDPYAEYLVVDDDGNEYTVRIDVWVNPTRKTQQEEKK